jgi:hypothetical protein
MAPLSDIATSLDSFFVGQIVVVVTPVRGNEPTSDAVKRLLYHVAALSFEVAGLLTDRGFYDGTSVDPLDAIAPVALPVIRRGKRMGTAFPARGLCLLPTGQWQVRLAHSGLRSVRSGQSHAKGSQSVLPETFGDRDSLPNDERGTCTYDDDRSSRSVVVRACERPVAEFVADRSGACSPRHGGRALPIWFRFEVSREWINHALDEALLRKWEIPANGVGIPEVYSQLNVIEPASSETPQRATALHWRHRAGALTGVRLPFCADFFSGEMNLVAHIAENQVNA